MSNRPRYDNPRFNSDNRGGDRGGGYSSNNSSRDNRSRPYSNNRDNRTDDRTDRHNDRSSSSYHSNQSSDNVKSEAVPPSKPDIKHETAADDYIPISNNSTSELDGGDGGTADMPAQRGNDYSGGVRGSESRESYDRQSRDRSPHRPSAVPKSYVASDGRKKFTGELIMDN